MQYSPLNTGTNDFTQTNMLTGFLLHRKPHCPLQEVSVGLTVEVGTKHYKRVHGSSEGRYYYPKGSGGE